ncbi:fumarate hydratase [Clostridia bacterium]|nr:fumarate hydratase [Clostridia bacterium]
MTLTPERIADTVAKLYIKSNRELPPDIVAALQAARDREIVPNAKFALEVMLENLKIANPLPICQDTGLAVVFVEWGGSVTLGCGTLQQAVDLGVARACKNGFLRPSIVRDPLRRVNTGDNTPAVLHTEIVAGDSVKITVLPKGFGSENMTRLKMFTPAAGREDILDFITETVQVAGANPCPPTVIGVGLGGTADSAVSDAKRALLLDVNEYSDDEFYAGMEREALQRVNDLKIGAQGFGGGATALGVRIVPRPTHIAGLPCAVALGCWVTRRAEEVI